MRRTAAILGPAFPVGLTNRVFLKYHWARELETLVLGRGPSAELAVTSLFVVGCRSERCSFDVLITEGDVMNIVLWIMQVLLAAAFLAHGWLFLSPPPEIAQQMNATLPRWFQLFLGIAEVLAAVGLTLPGLTRILPWLVTWAAGGIMIVTASATAFHLVRHELSSAATTMVLFGLATFVAYMRHRVLPIGVRRAV